MGAGRAEEEGVEDGMGEGEEGGEGGEGEKGIGTTLADVDLEEYAQALRARQAGRPLPPGWTPKLVSDASLAMALQSCGCARHFRDCMSLSEWYGPAEALTDDQVTVLKGVWEALVRDRRRLRPDPFTLFGQALDGEYDPSGWSVSMAAARNAHGEWNGDGGAAFDAATADEATVWSWVDEGVFVEATRGSLVVSHPTYLLAAELKSGAASRLEPKVRKAFLFPFGASGDVLEAEFVKAMAGSLPAILSGRHGVWASPPSPGGVIDTVEVDESTRPTLVSLSTEGLRSGMAWTMKKNDQGVDAVITVDVHEPRKVFVFVVHIKALLLEHTDNGEKFLRADASYSPTKAIEGIAGVLGAEVHVGDETLSVAEALVRGAMKSSSVSRESVVIVPTVATSRRMAAAKLSPNAALLRAAVPDGVVANGLVLTRESMYRLWREPVRDFVEAEGLHPYYCPPPPPLAAAAPPHRSQSHRYRASSTHGGVQTGPTTRF